jgi:feruloyl-CoA synthase
LLQAGGGADLERAHARVGPQTLAKILMTSGSSSAPKGVLTTQEMLCTNQQQIAQALPFVSRQPPCLVDWLPWNHVFGGSQSFNLVLARGGTLYIDDGKPLPERFGRTLENLAALSPTLSFNVPAGYALLVEALRRDAGLRRRFFARLDLLFYAGAPLPQETWDALEEMALQERGRAPLIMSSWGMTETAPACIMQQEPGSGSGVVGVPLAGVEARLLPLEDARYELRVRGANVTSGYYRDPGRTAEAFDGEGFLRTGDALRLVDAARPERGLRFAGRLSEDFKLASGTWVQAGALRERMLAALAPLAADLVVTGAGRDEIGVLLFADRAALAPLQARGDLLWSAAAAAELQERLSRAFAGAAPSARPARLLILAEPPVLGAGEMTAKGNLNPGRILERRAGLLARLYSDEEPWLIRLPPG